VLDVVRIIALIVAGTACLRPRYGLGLVVLLAITLIDAPAMVLPLVHRAEVPPTLFTGFILLLWGPSGMHTISAPSAPWPIARTALTGGLGLLASRDAYRRSKPLRPETPDARRWDSIGLRFLFVCVVDALLVVVGVLLRFLDV
jgi:hypothetical protein